MLKSAKLPQYPSRFFMGELSNQLFARCFELKPENIDWPKNMSDEDKEWTESIFYGRYDTEYFEIVGGLLGQYGKAPYKDFKKLTEVLLLDTATLFDPRALTECNMLKRVTILNPECEMRYQYGDMRRDIEVCGLPGSTAEEYCKATGHPFIALEDGKPLEQLHYTLPDPLDCISCLIKDDFALVTQIKEPVAYVESLSIPETYEGKPVKEIRLGTNAPGQTIQILNIPKTTEFIDFKYFYYNANLKSELFLNR